MRRNENIWGEVGEARSEKRENVGRNERGGRKKANYGGEELGDEEKLSKYG